ncbi:Wadjet anti-phage system protein JetA family protein [Caldicellulosiruptoraceae bacterium PP1]
MQLFSVLPSNLFSILSSKNKDIYVDALFTLRKAFKQEMTINKSDLVSMIISELDQKLLEIELDEEEAIENSMENDKNPSSIAHFLIRRLKETGWIDLEYKEDTFDEIVTLPDYSIKIINLLYSFVDIQTKEYNSYVYSTYSLLNTANQEQDNFYDFFKTAYENTINLLDELKTLHNNIRRFHQELNNYISINEILKSHFDDYKNLVFDRVYHPLKTFDSIPKYRIPILKILKSWLDDNNIKEKIAYQAIQRGKYKSQDEAMEDIISKLNEIIDIYEGINDILEQIDQRNSSYTRASIEKMRYMLNIDRSIKGKIVKMLSKLSELDEDNKDKHIEMMSSTVDLFKQGFLDENSLFIRAAKAKKKDQKPMEIKEIDIEDNLLLEEFIDRAKSLYSHAKVMEFVKSIMRELEVITTKDIIIENDQQFILLIFAILKSSDKNVFYSIEVTNDYLINNGYKVPFVIFKRKGLKNA